MKLNLNKTLVLFSGAFLLSFGAFAQGEEGGGNAVVDVMLWISYIMIIVAAIAAVVLSFLKTTGDKSGLVKSGLMLGVILVLFIIGYVLSGSEVTEVYQNFGVTEGRSKFIGGMLITTYLMIAIAVVGFVYSRIKDLFNT